MRNTEKKKKELIIKSIAINAGQDSTAHLTSDCNPNVNVGSCENFPIGFQAGFRYNIFESSFIHFDPVIEKMLGIPSHEIVENDPADLFYEIIPEENIEAMGELIQKSYQICKDNHKADSIVINIDFNVQTRDKVTKRILSQYRPIAFNESGYPIESSGYWTDISHIKKDGLPEMYAVVDNQLVHFEVANPDYLIKSPHIIYTSKEIEIIKLTSDGFRIKEISDKMKISISTVYTHRKNIKMKSEKEMNQVINELKSKGII